MSLSVDIYKDLFTSRKPYDSSSSIHELQIYLKSCLDLTKGLVIHFIDAAELSNDLVASIIPTYNATAPKQYWRYYKNMSGQYSDIDAPMYIHSLDTFERIELTVDTLREHKATHEALIKDTAFREQLLEEYPDNETLVTGIINPIPIDVCINAKDGEILHYPEHLVQFNEYSLIEDLNTWIYNHMDRWYNAQYIHADELYTASYYAILYPAIYNAILGLREDRIHTLEVHYFHVQQYLASNGLLDRHMDIMTHKQRLWLYRNIRYIRKHAGHEKTFRMMIEYLLVPSGIPLDGYRMSLVNAQTGIEPRFHTTPYTIEQSVGLEHHSLDTYRLLEARMLENALVPIQYQSNEIQHSKYGQVRTKMLESTIVDYDDDHVYSELDILHDHWLYYTMSDRYTPHINIADLNANESVSVGVKDAYILMRVLFSQITETPFVIRSPEVIQVLEHVDASDYRNVCDAILLKQAVDFVNFNLAPIVDRHLSIAAFGANIAMVYRGFDKIHRYMFSHTDAKTQIALTMMIDDIYHSVAIEEFEFDIAEWRATSGIVVNPIRMVDKITLYKSIINDSTGYNSLALSKQDIQDGLIDIMFQLSSYGVSYNNNANRRPINLMASISSRIVNIINYTVTQLYADFSNNLLRSRSDVLVEGSIDTPGYLWSIDHSVLKIDNQIDISIEHNSVIFHDIERNYITMETIP